MRRWGGSSNMGEKQLFRPAPHARPGPLEAVSAQVETTTPEMVRDEEALS